MHPSHSRELNTTQALKDAENALRDFIAATLQARLGTNWIAQCGVSPERLQRWEERKATEAKRQISGVVDERLIYYADFYDLRTILKKHWEANFSEVFGEWKTMEVYLNELERLRDPDAHRRELLPHQQHLAIGIAGEIRARLVRYRSKQDTAEDYFPRIESARDNLGNILVAGMGRSRDTGLTLRSGDTLEFVVTATDPMGQELEYLVLPIPGRRRGWQTSNILSFTVTDAQIAKKFTVALCIRSPRPYHAHEGFDDQRQFIYTVLPARREPAPTKSESGATHDTP